MFGMKHFLLGLMVVLVLTPVLACAMPFCPTQVNAAKEQPCHQANSNDGPMLVLDCMGVDLFQQDVSNDIQPDLSVDTIDYAWADSVIRYSFKSSHSNDIRGPPEQSGPLSRRSIILTTQRLRI